MNTTSDMNFDMALWFIGTFFICLVVLALIQFTYIICTYMFGIQTFDIQEFKKEVNKNLRWDEISKDTSVVENVCDVLMKKFSNVNSIVYEIGHDESSVEFVVFTNDLNKYHVQMKKEKEK